MTLPNVISFDNVDPESTLALSNESQTHFEILLVMGPLSSVFDFYVLYHASH
jgi:hypothetical protein